MRKFGTILTLLALVILCAVLLPTQAHAETEGYYTYTVSNGEATITACDTSIRGDVTIPSTLGGYPVTRIGDFSDDYGAFRDCVNMTSVTIPHGVTYIGINAFVDCTNLNGIAIPDSVYSIGAKAFLGCINLTSISIPNSVTNIGLQAFLRCSSLESIRVDADNPEYSNDAKGVLYNKQKTELICCPPCVSGEYIIPDTVTSIVRQAFVNCRNIVSVIIPDSVTSIGTDSFVNCNSLTGIWVDADNPEYSNDAQGVLYNKDKTKLLCCPGGFSGVYRINDGVAQLQRYAFSGCGNLLGVTIPASVIKIDEKTFRNCDNLWHILYKGSEKQWDAIAIDKVDNQPLLLATRHYNCTGNEITDPVNKVCTLCTPACAHTYDNACDTACNLCGDTRTITHTPGAAATATTDQICTVCGTVLAKATGETPSGGQTGGNATQSTTAPTQEETQPAQTTPPATTPPVQESTQPATQPTDGATAPVTQPATQPSQGDSSPTTQATNPSTTTGAAAESSGVTTVPETSGAPADSGKDGGGAVWVVVLVILGGGGVAAGIILWKKKH